MTQQKRSQIAVVRPMRSPQYPSERRSAGHAHIENRKSSLVVFSSWAISSEASSTMLLNLYIQKEGGKISVTPLLEKHRPLAGRLYRDGYKQEQR